MVISVLILFVFSLLPNYIRKQQKQINNRAAKYYTKNMKLN